MNDMTWLDKLEGRLAAARRDEGVREVLDTAVEDLERAVVGLRQGERVLAALLELIRWHCEDDEGSGELYDGGVPAHADALALLCEMGLVVEVEDGGVRWTRCDAYPYK